MHKLKQQPIAALDGGTDKLRETKQMNSRSEMLARVSWRCHQHCCTSYKEGSEGQGKGEKFCQCRQMLRGAAAAVNEVLMPASLSLASQPQG